MHSIYKFINEHNKVIYVGRTNNLIRRLRNEHFTKRGHLPESCYNETLEVQFATVANQNEAKTYELYYIEKYHPKYNKADIGGGSFTFTLEDLVWSRFDFDTDKKSKSKNEMLQVINTYTHEIENELRFAEKLLRNKDNASWLNKLENEERNDYLSLVYSIERFIQSVSERNKEVQNELN